MAPNPLSWLRDLLRGDWSSSSDATEPQIERRTARLFQCDDCETTFIGVDKRTCSRCDGSVREIPNERELERSQSEGGSASPSEGGGESPRPHDR